MVVLPSCHTCKQWSLIDLRRPADSDLCSEANGEHILRRGRGRWVIGLRILSSPKLFCLFPDHRSWGVLGVIFQNGFWAPFVVCFAVSLIIYFNILLIKTVSLFSRITLLLKSSAVLSATKGNLHFSNSYVLNYYF